MAAPGSMWRVVIAMPHTAPCAQSRACQLPGLQRPAGCMGCCWVSTPSSKKHAAAGLQAGVAGTSSTHTATHAPTPTPTSSSSASPSSSSLMSGHWSSLSPPAPSAWLSARSSSDGMASSPTSPGHVHQRVEEGLCACMPPCTHIKSPPAFQPCTRF